MEFITMISNYYFITDVNNAIIEMGKSIGWLLKDLKGLIIKQLFNYMRNYIFLYIIVEDTFILENLIAGLHLKNLTSSDCYLIQ